MLEMRLKELERLFFFFSFMKSTNLEIADQCLNKEKLLKGLVYKQI
jgi:hypothetical protein